MKGARTDVLLAFLRETVPLLFAVPAFPILDRPHGDGKHHRAAALDRAGSVADRAAPAISDRPAYSRGRSEVASEKSGDADDGRTIDLPLDRGANAAVGEPAAALDMGRAHRPIELRRRRAS